MVWNEEPTARDEYKKLPVEGIVLDYGIEVNQSDIERIGCERLNLVIEKADTQKEIKVKLDMGNFNDRGWTKQEFQLEDGRILETYHSPWYSEYRSLKVAAEDAGIRLRENIEPVSPEQIEEKKPVITITEVGVKPGTPDLVGMYVKLTVSTTKGNDGIERQKYITSFLGKSAPNGQRSVTDAYVPPVPANAPPRRNGNIVPPVTPTVPARKKKEPVVTAPQTDETPTGADPIGEAYASVVPEIQNYIKYTCDFHKVGAVTMKLLKLGLQNYNGWKAGNRLIGTETIDNATINFVKLVNRAIANGDVVKSGEHGQISLPVTEQSTDDEYDEE